MILLDTNVLSELRKPARRRHPAVHSWSEHISSTSTYLSVLTIAEIERGILLLEQRDSHQAKLLNRWFTDQVLASHARRILPVTLDIARTAARLQALRTLPEIDAYIAATALVHEMPLATRNIKDFEGTGVALINPFDL